MSDYNKQLYEKIMKDVSKVVKKHLNEIGYRGAALAHGANYNASQDLELTWNIYADKKMSKSNNLRLKALNLALHDNFSNMLLKFIETDKANNRYPVDFKFKEVLFASEDRFVFKGSVNVSEQNWEDGYIEYVNTTTKKSPSHFYRVKYYANGTIKRMYQLKPHPRYAKDIEEVWAFMRNFHYAEKDYESNINNNGHSSSKQR